MSINSYTSNSFSSLFFNNQSPPEQQSAPSLETQEEISSELVTLENVPCSEFLTGLGVTDVHLKSQDRFSIDVGAIFISNLLVDCPEELIPEKIKNRPLESKSRDGKLSAKKRFYTINALDVLRIINYQTTHNKNHLHFYDKLAIKYAKEILLRFEQRNQQVEQTPSKSLLTTKSAIAKLLANAPALDDQYRNYFSGFIETTEKKCYVDSEQLKELLDKQVDPAKNVRGLYYRLRKEIEDPNPPKKEKLSFATSSSQKRQYSYLTKNPETQQKKQKKTSPIEIIDSGKMEIEEDKPLNKLEDSSANMRKWFLSLRNDIQTLTVEKKQYVNLTDDSEIERTNIDPSIVADSGKMEIEEDVTATYVPFAESERTTDDTLELAEEDNESPAVSLLDKFMLNQSFGSEALLKIIKDTEPLDINGKSLPKPSKKQMSQLKTLENQVKAAGIPNNMSIIKLDPPLGDCLFLNADAEALQPGDVIGFYTGEYRLADISQKRAEDTSYIFELGLSYGLTQEEIVSVFGPSSPYSESTEFILEVDALQKGCYTRFSNHQLLENNAEAEVYLMPNGLPELIIIATKPILPGQQIMLTYGGQYWKKKNIIPDNVYPGTFTINQQKEVIAHPEKKDVYTTQEIRSHLSSFRRPFAKNDNQINVQTGFVKKTPLSSKIKLYAEEIHEQGITSPFTLMRLPGTKEWGVFLKPSHAPIKKNTFIGIFGGSYEAQNKEKEQMTLYRQEMPNNLSSEISEGTFAYIQVNASVKGNFTREINFSKKACNLTTKVQYLGDLGYQIVILSSAKILPGQQLLLSTGKKVEALLSMTPSTFAVSEPQGLMDIEK